MINSSIIPLGIILLYCTCNPTAYNIHMTNTQVIYDSLNHSRRLCWLWFPRRCNNMLLCSSLTLQCREIKRLAPPPFNATPPPKTLMLCPQQRPNPRLYVPSHFQRHITCRSQSPVEVSNLVLWFRVPQTNDADFRVICVGTWLGFLDWLLLWIFLGEQIVDSLRADRMELGVGIYDCVPDYGLGRGG